MVALSPISLLIGNRATSPSIYTALPFFQQLGLKQDHPSSPSSPPLLDTVAEAETMPEAMPEGGPEGGTGGEGEGESGDDEME